MSRPTALKFLGAYLDFGDGRKQPDRWLANIPARDLDEADIAQLSDEQLANATGGPNPLYREVKAKTETEAPKIEAAKAGKGP